MTIIANVINTAERISLPDWMTLAGVEFLVSRTDRRLAKTACDVEQVFVEAMRNFPVAVNTDDANAQHYEVPAEFFTHVLGSRRKYSCCFYESPSATLDQAERSALFQTALHADLQDGQTILELGCGWGSLSLYMAETFRNSTIVAVSNSNSQRAYIEAQAARLGLTNLTVLTQNMVTFEPARTFNRIVSVEMFEHMSNWRELLSRARRWLNPNGRLFVHVFTHKDRSYRFDHSDKSDWIAQHFFTGGIMPAHDLIHRFDDLFSVEEEWRWSGTHYERTAFDWLANFDRNDHLIRPILNEVYGDDANLWHRRWRLFFLATAGLFGHGDGQTWGVSHYRLAPQ